MQASNRSPDELFARDPVDPGVCVVDGFGLRIHVARGHLVVIDGIAGHRRERKFARAGHGLRRLVVLGNAGTASLEAIRWLQDVGVDYVHLEPHGRVLVTSAAPGLNQPALRRAQARAAGAATGLAITRMLLEAKLAGQAQVARHLGADQTAAAIDAIRDSVGAAGDVDSCRSLEAAAAVAYWNEAWSTLPVGFVRRDTQRIPDRWRTFSSRQSALASEQRGRRATNPANAILNYLYALGEAEASLALRIVGLDPGLGFAHVDQRGRDSASLDLLEAIRPDIDNYVVTLLESRTFQRADFIEGRDGICRISPPLTHELAGTLPSWADLLAPVAEKVAQHLAHTAGLSAVSTPLTQTRRARGRPQGPRRRTEKTRMPLPVTICETCGAELPDPNRRTCDACLPETRRRQGEEFAARSRGQLARLRSQGADPSQSAASKRRSGEAISKQHQANRAWEQTNPEPGDASVFRKEILPLIRDVPLSTLAAATGLSRQHLSYVRQGKRVPHRRHWNALRAAGADCDR